MNKIYLPLRSKFILLFCLLITIPILVIGAITYQKYSSDVERNTAELTYQVVNQIKINLDRYVKEMERLTLTPHYDDNVMEILRNHNGPYQDQIYLTTDETLKMNLYISSLTFDRSEIEGMLIFTNDGSIFSNLDQSVSKYWEPGSSGWMEAVKEKDGGLVIIPPHEASYYLKKRSVVSVARVVREPYTNEMLGIVKVDLTPKGFETILDSVSFSKRSRLYIKDKEGALLYSSADDAAGSSDSHISAEIESDYTGLQVIGIIPREDMRQDARDLTRFTLVITLIALLFAYMIAVFTSNRLVKPIAHLQSKMRQVQRGLFKERAIVTTNDEIGQLTEGFNTMIGEIEHLVKEVYETRLREREAELSALQSQIHPHFLYNTLEMINMLALQGKQRELSSIVTSLGKLLRYTVDKRENQVLLQDEIRFVESYLQIQELRLGDKLQTEIGIDPSFDYCQVPKLILQPLVENVIEHALGEAPVRIRLTASSRGDELILSIRDNGRGMSRERMEWLEKQLNTAEQDRELDRHDNGGFGKIKKGFALKNVHQRIRLLYGEPYGITLDQTAQQGVSIFIRLPIHWGR